MVHESDPIFRGDRRREIKQFKYSLLLGSQPRLCEIVLSMFDAPQYQNIFAVRPTPAERDSGTCSSSSRLDKSQSASKLSLML